MFRDKILLERTNAWLEIILDKDCLIIKTYVDSNKSMAFDGPKKQDLLAIAKTFRKLASEL